MHFDHVQALNIFRFISYYIKLEATAPENNIKLEKVSVRECLDTSDKKYKTPSKKS